MSEAGVPVNGEVAHEATGAAVLGHPAEAVARLANFLAASGRWLEAGWTVLSGGLTDAIAVAPGHLIEVTVEGIGDLRASIVA